jgi:hypothetical protein
MNDPAGTTRSATLTGVSSSRTDSTVTFTTDVGPTGGGIFVSAVGRQVGSSAYEGRAWISASGAVQAQALVNGNAVQAVTVAGVTYAAGQQLNLRVQAVGVSPTTLRVKVWPATQAEPASWQVSTTDSTAGLQSAGAVGLRAYLSASASATPVTVRFDNYLVTAVP